MHDSHVLYLFYIFTLPHAYPCTHDIPIHGLPFCIYYVFTLPRAYPFCTHDIPIHGIPFCTLNIPHLKSCLPILYLRYTPPWLPLLLPIKHLALSLYPLYTSTCQSLRVPIICLARPRAYPSYTHTLPYHIHTPLIPSPTIPILYLSLSCAFPFCTHNIPCHIHTHTHPFIPASSVPILCYLYLSPSLPLPHA